MGKDGMAENSKIEWTDHTYNPWVGCTKVSPACDHCYAEDWAKRFNSVSWGPGQRKRTSAANWRKPIKWDAEAKASGVRAKVFCASLADVFDNDRSITSDWRGDLWNLISRTTNLDWLLLTKRPQNIKKMLPEEYGAPEWGAGWPNVWLGTTAENQEEADRRIPHLLAIPAAVRFVSAEPLLGPIDFTNINTMMFHGAEIVDALTGSAKDTFGIQMYPFPAFINQIIIGGESGPNARPMHPDWARSIRDQCKAAGTAYFFKQYGSWLPIHNEGEDGWQADDGGKDGRFEGKHAHIITSGGQMFANVGKKSAGRLLDGVEHNAMPGI
jgi:protein gp37